MTVKSYKDLLVWQKAMDLAEEVYLAVGTFPREERYGLTSQLQRAAVSVPSNIAEGSSRRSKAEFIRFVNIASGSLAELETQLALAKRFSYAEENVIYRLLALAEEVSKMLFALQQSLSEKNAA